MTNPQRAEQPAAELAPSIAITGHAAELAVAGEPEKVRRPKSEAIALTWLWAETTFGASPTRMKRSRLIEAMKAPWAAGGMGMTKDAAYRRIATMVETGCWEQLGDEIQFAAPPADDFARVRIETPVSLFSFDPSKVKGSKAKTKEKVEGELRIFFKGSRERIAEILDATAQPTQTALTELIGDVLDALGDGGKTHEAKRRKTAEMLLASWRTPGEKTDRAPEGMTARDAFAESLDVLANTERFVGGPGGLLDRCLSYRGFDYRAYFSRAPPAT